MKIEWDWDISNWFIQYYVSNVSSLHSLDIGPLRVSWGSNNPARLPIDGPGQ